MKQNYTGLVERINRIDERINEIEKSLEWHTEKEHELLDLINVERKYRRFYSKEISMSDVIMLIPFEVFDLCVDGRFVRRGATRNDLLKLNLNTLYGHTIRFSIIDVRISLRESLVDLITETR